MKNELLEKIKDDVAKYLGYGDYESLTISASNSRDFSFYVKATNEIAIKYANEKLKMAAESVQCFIPWDGEDPQVSKGSILKHLDEL